MSSVGTVNWGVISTARIGTEKVIPAMQAGGVQILAICSRDADCAAAVAAEMGIPRHYGSYQDLLDDPDIDAVYNPLPNSLHAEWTIKAAEAGKHVLCEKPMADNVEQAIAMTRACAANDVHLMEAFMWRFGNRARQVRELVREGAIGEPRLVRASFSFPLPRDPANVRLQKELSGGALEDAGCYPVNATRFLMDAEPESVEARLRFDPEFEVNMSGVASMIYPDGRMALVDFSFEHERRQLLEVVGTEGRIEVESFILPSPDDAIIRIVRGGEDEIESFPPVSTYALQAEAMNRAVSTGESLPWDGDDAIRQVRVLDAIRESHRTGTRVKLEPHQKLT